MLFVSSFMTILSDLKNEQMELKAQAEENSGWFSLTGYSVWKTVDNVKLKT